MPRFDIRIAALREQAAAAEQAGDFDKASRCYDAAGQEYLLWAVRGSPAVEADRKARGLELIRRASRLRGGGADEAPPPDAHRDARGGTAARSDTPPSKSTVEDSIQSAVASFLMPSTITWNDVAGLDDEVEKILTALCMAFARYPESISLPRSRNLLFHGVPGTGKTLIASAVCSSLMDRPGEGEEVKPMGVMVPTFFNVSLAGLISKWVGESSKTVAHLFEEAARLAPSVVFLDEFESITQRRSGGDSSHDRQVLSQVLTQLDGFAGKSGDRAVIVIAATNRPWDMDEAVLSRFGLTLHIPPPQASAREAILDVLIRNSGVEFAGNLAELASDRISARYSGRDLRNWFIMTVQTMLEQANRSPSLADTARRGLGAMRDYVLDFTSLTNEHFIRTSGMVYPQITPEQVEAHLRWAEDPSYRPEN